jgi:hypothetical protein
MAAMRRIRQRTTFGPTSQRERRNSELFFADLMGLRAPQARLTGGNAETFYEELVGRARPRGFIPESLPEIEAVEDLPEYLPEDLPEDKPAPAVTAGRDENEIIVTRADGSRYHIIRKVRAQVYTRPGRPRFGFCTDDDRVFFRLAWCEGTQGRIDAGANPQGAFKDLLDKVLGQISRGESPDEIKRTFENASIQTFLSIDITKVGSWKITGDLKLELNRSGIQSTSAKVSADRGWIKLGVEYKDGTDGKQVMATIEIPLEKRTVKGKACPVKELVVWWEVECLREIPITVPIKPLIDTIPRTDCLYLYFDYAKDTLRRDPKIRAASGTSDEVTEILRSDPQAGTARLNKRQLERLEHLVGLGYWVTAVNGYASPEGRRRGPDKSDRGLMAKWEGNDALSKARAEKIRKLIEARYRPTLGMRASPTGPPLMRYPAGQLIPQGVGLSENPRLDKRLGEELEGDALDRAVILGATLGVKPDQQVVKPFLEQYPHELLRMTEEDQKFVTDKTKTVRQRAGLLFENLRRVEIRLMTLVKMKPGSLRTFTLEHVNPCPDDLIKEAESKWGPRIPLFKPDPPLCK